MKSPIFLFVACLVAGLALSSYLIERAKLGAHNATVICARIHTLDTAMQVIVASTKPTKAQLNKFAYYREHPDERDAVIRGAGKNVNRMLATLRKADCG